MGKASVLLFTKPTVVKLQAAVSPGVIGMMVVPWFFKLVRTIEYFDINVERKAFRMTFC